MKDHRIVNMNQPIGSTTNFEVGKKEINEKRSKYWLELCEILEREFPKGKCKERGHALVLLAYAEMALRKAEEEKHLAKQCLNVKGFNCANKNCLNEACPLCQKK